MNIELAADTVTESDLRAVAAWIVEGNRLTKGPETLAFEEEFAARVGSEHAVFVNSGSSANLLMVAALKESGKLRNNVAVAPAVSWVTTVSPLIQLGFDTFLCDADPKSLGLNIEHLEQLFRRHNPSILILVHVLGHPNPMVEILELCDRYGVVLLEDACEALGSTDSDGRHLGTIGVAGSYSLYFGHHLSTIEGGVIVTGDQQLHQMVVALRSHGWARDLGSEAQHDLRIRYGIDEFRNLYTFYHPGYNLRSTDLQAFVGRRQLQRLGQVSSARARIAAEYRSALPAFYCQESPGAFVSEFAFGTLVTEPAYVASELLEGGIESRPLICGNIGRHPFWLDRFGPASLPVADQVHDFGIYLPIHAEMTSEEVAYVASSFAAVAVPYVLQY